MGDTPHRLPTAVARVSLSAESVRRIVVPMTKRKRNSLIDLGLAFLVVLACIGTATVTLAGKI